ncbi:MAG: hypothetical protein NTY53_17035 [Kiritimatiellaeota bacterium]|nr:hypothetical protein [Kiritimatiellota bacterium]
MKTLREQLRATQARLKLAKDALWFYASFPSGKFAAETLGKIRRLAIKKAGTR